MTWATAGSAMFGAFLYKPLLNNGGATGYGGLAADTIKVALFNNTTAPDKTVAVGTSGYNSAASQWVVANEVTDPTNWVAGGRTLAGAAVSSISGGTEFTGSNLAGGGTLTITNAYGCLVYDHTITAGTVADQGICFNYFGGAQSVAGGSFTIVWNASGICQINA